MEEKMVEVEMSCGCFFQVPESISEDMGEVEGYLLDEKYINVQQMDVSRFDAVCSKCHRTIMKDI